MPGSRDRARCIAERYLRDITVRESKRGYDSYIGTFAPSGSESSGDEDGIDVGVISTGMGAPSVDIIVTELIRMGARVLIRVGTAGSLQHWVHSGDIVIASAAVRDEGTTRHYLPLEFPAIADAQVVAALTLAASRMDASHAHLAGVVHTKDSLMAREFQFGPYASVHAQYMRTLSELNCLASEMECAMLFALGQLYARRGVRVGAVLAVLGESDKPFGLDAAGAADAVDCCIAVAMMSLCELRSTMQRRNPTLPSLDRMTSDRNA